MRSADGELNGKDLASRELLDVRGVVRKHIALAKEHVAGSWVEVFLRISLLEHLFDVALLVASSGESFG